MFWKMFKSVMHASIKKAHYAVYVRPHHWYTVRLDRRPNQKVKPEVRHVLRPAAMLNCPTWGVKDYSFYCKTDIFRSFWLIYSLSIRRNHVKSGISRTSTHHRSMKNIRMLKELTTTNRAPSPASVTLYAMLNISKAIPRRGPRLSGNMKQDVQI